MVDIHKRRSVSESSTSTVSSIQSTHSESGDDHDDDYVNEDFVAFKRSGHIFWLDKNSLIDDQQFWLEGSDLESLA